MGENLAKLILRVTLGGMMLFHGIHKLQHGIGFIKGMVKGQGLPEFIAYGVYVGEIVAPLLLILGWMSRIWAGVIAFNMLVAIYLTKIPYLMELGDHGAWAVELPMFYFLTSLAVMMLGSGSYAIKRD